MSTNSNTKYNLQVTCCLAGSLVRKKFIFSIDIFTIVGDLKVSLAVQMPFLVTLLPSTSTFLPQE